MTVELRTIAAASATVTFIDIFASSLEGSGQTLPRKARELAPTLRKSPLRRRRQGLLDCSRAVEKRMPFGITI
jgi:hypothetical protein